MLKLKNLILLDENYASFVVSLFVHKMGGGEGALTLGGNYFKFWPIGGRFFQAEGGGGGAIRGSQVW